MRKTRLEKTISGDNRSFSGAFVQQPRRMRREMYLLTGTCCLLAAILFQPILAGSVFSRVKSVFGGGRSRVDDESATERPTMVDPQLMVLSEDLYKLDQKGNAGKGQLDWAVNTRSSSGRFFTRMNDALLSKPTYAKFIALLDNYNPVLGRPEEVTAQERGEQSSFLDAIIATPVVRRAWEYLKTKGVAPTSQADFKDLLQRIWFTIYKRRGQPDTSGFEHVFVGELDGGAPNAPVSGFHNWIQYYLEEKSGRAVYQRWKGQSDPDIFGLQFLWNGHPKIKSTMSIGESPEMSFAVLTTCFLVTPNNECKLRMGGAPVSVITHKWTTRNPKEFYVASAYYDS